MYFLIFSPLFSGHSHYHWHGWLTINPFTVWAKQNVNTLLDGWMLPLNSVTPNSFNISTPSFSGQFRDCWSLIGAEWEHHLQPALLLLRSHDQPFVCLRFNNHCNPQLPPKADYFSFFCFTPPPGHTLYYLYRPQSCQPDLAREYWSTEPKPGRWLPRIPLSSWTFTIVQKQYCYRLNAFREPSNPPPALPSKIKDCGFKNNGKEYIPGHFIQKLMLLLVQVFLPLHLPVLLAASSI